MLKVEEIAEKLRVSKWLRNRGSKDICRKLGCTVQDVIAARSILKAMGYEPTYHYSRGSKSNVKQGPKILIFDLETSPMLAYVWGRWNQNISLDATVSEWFMICWSAKWLYDTNVMSDCLTPEEALKNDDSRITASLWELINEADIVVAHNAKRADVKWMNSRFIIHGMNPPKSYHVIDTLEIAKKEFGFSSNKLDALAGYFNIEHKDDTDFNLWVNCLHGDQESLDYMVKYNKKDVTILEEVYIKLRPWMRSHPNVGNYFNNSDVKCACCGSSNIREIKDNYYVTPAGKYKMYRCSSCGAVSRSRSNIKENINELISVSR